MQTSQSFNATLVETRNDLVDYKEYRNEFIKNVSIFKTLDKYSKKKGISIPSSLLEKYTCLKNVKSMYLKNSGFVSGTDYEKRKNKYYITFNVFEILIKRNNAKSVVRVAECKVEEDGDQR